MVRDCILSHTVDVSEIIASRKMYLKKNKDLSCIENCGKQI